MQQKSKVAQLDIYASMTLHFWRLSGPHQITNTKVIQNKHWLCIRKTFESKVSFVLFSNIKLRLVSNTKLTLEKTNIKSILK